MDNELKMMAFALLSNQEVAKLLENVAVTFKETHTTIYCLLMDAAERLRNTPTVTVKR